ncbi:CD226 antigen-like [Neoarius graeffei]|uniref:CD226 antigen-like n=1 Tax=Neoarius graeffei TaxID=443677 RepID=UPI00298D4B77|nr:CD226 antigen-like [Neoarius graeffei]
MTDMKVTAFLLMVCLSEVQSLLSLNIPAIVKEPVILPCTCSGQKVEWTIFHPIKDSIAACQDHACQIKPRFQKRFSFLDTTSTGNFSMNISSAFYNDAGLYSCTCSGSVHDVKLQVYDPRIVKVFPGENTTLPCHGDTRRDVEDVLWKKDGEKVLQYHSARTKEAPAGRFTMSNESFLDGDLSLHISSVHLSDGGLYLCLLQGESRDGDPRAVLLKVEERQPTTSNNCTEPSLGIRLGITLGLVLVVLLLIIGVICLRNGTGSQNMVDAKLPVQENGHTSPKDSSTLPILDEIGVNAQLLVADRFVLKELEKVDTVA